MSDNHQPQDGNDPNPEFLKQVISQLQCPICYETCLPPIFMCRNGHGICANCQVKLKSCSECRAHGKPTARSVQLEKIAELVKIPCPNQKHGCKFSFVVADEMTRHLSNCAHCFVCYICPDGKGSARELHDHVRSKHTSCYLGTVLCDLTMRFWTTIPTEKSYHDRPYFYMFTIADDVFWFQMKYTSATEIFSAGLYLLSCDDKEAERYYYSVEFRPKDEKKEVRVFHEALVKPINSTAGNIQFVLPSEITESFGDGKVWYKLKISRRTPLTTPLDGFGGFGGFGWS